MSSVTLTIDGREVTVPEGKTILEAAKTAGIRIPTLCFHERLKPIASCRMCVVEIEGYSRPMAACDTLVVKGISVITNSDTLLNIRRDSLKLILASHPLDCPICDKGGECLLQDLVYEFGIDKAEYQIPSREKNATYATPLIRYWPDRCIMCLRCAAACREIKRIGVIDIKNDDAGHALTINPDICVSCGECLMVCPTGALTENVSRYKGRPWLTDRVMTTCTYCGCGCQMELNVLNNRVIGVTTKDNVGVNKGSLCVRGRFGYEFIGSEERLTKPLIKKNGKFQESSWEEALSLVAERFSRIKETRGPDAFAALASARCTNEEIYLFQKFVRAVMGTNNVDNCARLWHSSTVEGLAASFGSGEMTNPIRDVLKAQVILVTGTNTTESNPIFANYIKEAVFRNGAKLIVVDPRRIDLVNSASIWLRPRPGTDVAWINGMMHIIIKEGMHDQQYIKNRTTGFNEYKKCIEKYTPEHASEISGIPVKDLYEAARVYGSAKPASILYATGITQHTNGADNVKSLGNLAMLCGNVGVEGGGVNPLLGQNNVQGACDLGAMPNVLTAYQQVSNDDVRSKFSKAWGVNNLPSKPGLTASGMFSAAESGRVKAMYIMGENVMISDSYPNHIERCIKALDFFVVQDIFLTETARMADVVFPGLAFAEKDGTFTNSERKVQRVRKAINPPGEARDDLWIIGELAGRMGYKMHCSNSREVMEEIRKVTPGYAGITYERIETGEIAWPCLLEEQPGTPILHVNEFSCGRGVFFPIDYRPPAESPDENYPFILTTGRVMQHFHIGTINRHGKGLNRLYPELLADVNHEDGARLGLKNGDFVKITSRTGSFNIKALLTDRPYRGVIFVPFHFYDAAVNLLANCAVDPVAKIPGHKICPVRLEKAS